MRGLLLQVAELKRKLAELGLDNKGTKAELIARVEKYLTEQGLSVCTFAVAKRGPLATVFLKSILHEQHLHSNIHYFI